MNKEHILPQNFRLNVLYPGPFPDRSFTGHMLEELFVALCSNNHDFRSFERIGVDAGARMFTQDVRECRIEAGTISLRDRMNSTSFDPFCERVLDLLRVVNEHLDCLPMFSPRVYFSAVWPSEHETDLRDAFPDKLVSIQRAKFDALGSVIRNVGLSITCGLRGPDEEKAHCRLEVEPDISDRHQLRVSVDMHYHESIEEWADLSKMLRETFEFLTDRAGSLIQSLGIE